MSRAGLHVEQSWCCAVHVCAGDLSKGSARKKKGGSGVEEKQRAAEFWLAVLCSRCEIEKRNQLKKNKQTNKQIRKGRGSG